MRLRWGKNSQAGTGAGGNTATIHTAAMLLFFWVSFFLDCMYGAECHTVPLSSTAITAPGCVTPVYSRQHIPAPGSLNDEQPVRKVELNHGGAVVTS